MKSKSIRSIFLAVIAVFLTAVTAAPFAAFAQENAPEVILTLEGNYKGQVQFVFTGDTIQYSPSLLYPNYPPPTDVTVDGKPWKDLDQPFKLDLTPDFENVTIKGKVDGSKVILVWRPNRVELTLNDPEEGVRSQLKMLGKSDLLPAHATHFVVPLIVKNIHSNPRLGLTPMGPYQAELMSALERRTMLETTLRILEEAPDTPGTPGASLSRQKTIDMTLGQLKSLDERIGQLKELAEKEAARDTQAANEAAPAAQPVEQRLQKAFDMREKLEAELRAIEQAREDEAQAKAKTISLVSRDQRIESMRQRIDKLDRTISKLKEEAAGKAQGTNKAKPASPSATTAKTASSAPGQKTNRTKELSLMARQAIAGDLNRQGFRLLRTLGEEKETENKFISPYSIDSAFGMVYTGAKGRTADEIRSVLGMPADPADADTFFLLMSDQYHAAENVDVLVSNSVWVDRRVTDLIRPNYYKTIETYYGGAFYVEDFRKKESVADKVNALVDRNTRGMIREVITPDDLTEQTRMILLNTLFFEAKWLHPFPVATTRPTPFYLFGGRSKQVQMMYQKRHFDYYSCEEDNVHAVVLPYENDRFELVALMPIQPGGDHGQAAMKSILAKIGDKLDSWLADPSPYETRVYLPKVDLTDSMRLQDPLKDLGMPSAFSPFTADFSGMFDYSKNSGDERFYIEKVIHKTALKMDEYSTKAAAATAIIGGFGGGMSRPQPENTFRADRPFLVLIRDNRTGLILFMGRINDPGN